LLAFFCIAIGVGMLWAGRRQWQCDKESERFLWYGFAMPFIIGGLFVMFWVPTSGIRPSAENVWVDFDSQVVVERDTYLFPRPNVNHQLSFSDIDHILWDVDKGDVLLVKNDESEFKLYDSATWGECQRLAQELEKLMDKPLEVVEHG